MNTDVPHGLYRAVSRWHFYAGLVVVPILLVLATSGIVMLLRAPLEAALYGPLQTVTPGVALQTPGAQLAAVEAAFPHTQTILFVPPTAPDHSSEFSIVPAHTGSDGHGHGHGETSLSVYVDPYTSHILGSIDPARTPHGWANAIHGTLLMGDIGDAIIEVAAGFAVLLIVSGLYLARPRGQGWRVMLTPPVSVVRRADTRALHGAIGYWIAVPLLFFLLSGLTWTGVWGGRVVQPWNTVALERDPPATPSSRTHSDLNRDHLEEVPWVLEQTPLPVSSGAIANGPGAGPAPDLDRVVDFARTMGFTRFRVSLPRDHNGVWTISASTLAGDVDAPDEERFLHLDRHTGSVLADVRYSDYSLVGRFMASGVPFHQGELGTWNLIFNALFCLAVIVLVTLGTTLWWQRRPGRVLLVAPPAPDPRIGRQVVAGMFVCALVFPLTAAVIAVVIVFDRLIVLVNSRTAH